MEWKKGGMPVLNIKKYRKKAGFTQAAAAKKLGVSSNAVSQWETGTRSPSVTRLRLIAELFGCRIDDLLSLATEKEQQG